MIKLKIILYSYCIQTIIIIVDDLDIKVQFAHRLSVYLRFLYIQGSIQFR